jgi:hypothetical protein
MTRSNVILAAVLVFASQTATPQESGKPEPAATSQLDTLLRRNNAGILLDQNLNTFFWQGRANVDTTIAGIHASIREQYQATVVHLESDPLRKLQSSQQQAAMALSVPLIGPLAASLRWDSFVYNDSRDVGLSRASSNTGFAGFDLVPIDGLTVSPMAGYRWDNQTGFRDRGPAYLVTADLRPVLLDGYLLDASGQFRQDNPSPRRIENHLLRAGIQKSFSEYTRDSLTFGLFRIRRDLYSPDSSIESRQDFIIQFSNLLRYDLAANVQTNVFVGLSSRGLDKILDYPTGLRPLSAFDTHVEEFHLDTYIEGRWHSDDNQANALLRLGYSERNELHTILSAPEQSTGPLLSERTQQEENKNNLSRTTSLFGRGSIMLSNSDELYVNGTMSLLRYDTPSDQNTDDRDELLTAVSIGTIHRLSRALELGVSLDGTLSHLVYLHSDLSANNNINRVIRLYPRATFRPLPWLVSANAFEVMASYTVYDFEFAGEAVRSYSYRQFSWLDSTAVELTNRVGIDGYAYIKLYERGQLRWSEFTEQIENSFVDRTLMAQIRFRPDFSFLIALGLKYFTQIRYVHSVGGTSIDSYFRSIGPTCLVRWAPGPHGEIGLRGWYENRRMSDGSTMGLTTLTFTILMNL